MTPPDLFIDALAATALRWAEPGYAPRAEAVEATLAANEALTFSAVTFAVNQTMSVLTPEALRAWAGGRRAAAPRTVGVLHAGNIPLGELQDWAAVLLAGHRYRGVVSSRSPFLLPAFAADVSAACPGLDSAFTTFEALFADAEVILATGSDETRALVAARCEAANIPPERRLLRGHRYSVAVLDGRETEAERERLAEDVLLHEGRGCRSVALVWAPEGGSPDAYLEAFAQGRAMYDAPPTTAAALKLPAAFLKATKQPHALLDDGSLLVSKGDPEAQAPGHLRWAEYADLGHVQDWLAEHAETLQLVAAAPRLHAKLSGPVPLISLGDTQRPPLSWQPDGIDTLGWLAAR